MSEAIQAGISRKTLYAMLEAGVVERLSRGVYRLTSLPSLETPDLVAAAARIPNGVICLISALAYHELTTQIPHAVDVAIEQGKRPPRVEYPPVNIFYFSGAAFTDGIETKKMGGVDVHIYSAEKSIADLFKYRNKLGLDTALEALRSWQKKRSSKPDTLLDYARICRVEKIVRPYLEALT
jgi:predicted transcriptional regulator of viral defense system